MISFDSKFKVMIGLEPIDFRCGINRLAALAESEFSEDSRSAIIFVFRNKRKTDVKLVGYHTNGFFLGHKRLSRGKLSWWPRNVQECESLDGTQLVKLLKGIDPRGGFQPDQARLDEWETRGQSDSKIDERGTRGPEEAH